MVTLRHLVFNFLELCGLQPLKIRPGIWQINADDALMKELDGWRASGRILQFTFDPKQAQKYGADLIDEGSYRFNTILRLIRKQGLFSLAHIPHHFFHEPDLQKKAAQALNPRGRTYVLKSCNRFGQYLILNILVSQRGLQQKESVHSPCVNLSTAEVLKFPVPPRLVLPGGVPGDNLNKRKCTLKKAYEAAASHLLKQLEQEEHAWAELSRQKLSEEKEQLAQFFEDRTDSPDFAGKIRELEQRFEPSVEMNVLRGALLYVPLFCYRMITVQPGAGEKAVQVCFDPLSNSLEADQLLSHSPDGTGAHDQN